MKILVTGWLGAVGSHLVAELRGRGHEVWVCDLYHDHHAQYRRCDVSEFRQVERMINEVQPQLVYHLAAEFGRWNGEDFYENLWLTNAIGTKNILRMQEQHGFRLVFFSSSEVYGDYDGVMSEDVMDRLEVKQMNDYAITKWVGEMQVLNSARMFGTETVRVRLFNTYGPGEYYSPYRSMVCVFTYRLLHDQPIMVYLDHHRTSTYVTDTCRTLANIAENFKPGEIYNIGGTEYHDVKQISDMLLNYLGKSEDLVRYMPAEPHTTRDKKVDLSKAFNDLGHEPRITLQQGIPMTVEWMKHVYQRSDQQMLPVEPLALVS